MQNKTKSKKDEKERPISEIDFRNTSDKLKEEYLDIQSTVRDIKYYQIQHKFRFKYDLFRKNKHSKGK